MNGLYSCVRRRLRLLVAGIVGVLISAAASAVDWTIEDLGTLGGTYSSAFGISNRGWVVGESTLSGNTVTHAFLYDGTSFMRDLRPLDGNSRATGINSNGLVVGWWRNTSGDTTSHAFLYDGTGVRDLPTLGGSYSEARGINASGQVVGDSTLSGDTVVHAFLYDGTGMRDLLPLGGGSAASGINASGQVVGRRSNDIGFNAFLYDGTGTRDLGTLGGIFSEATGINASGQVVGWSQDLSASMRPFFYNGTAMRGLDASSDTLVSINSRGQIVGWGFLYDGAWRDPVIVPTRFLGNLPEAIAAGWYGIAAGYGINDSGQIVGPGDIGGNRHAYRLHPQATSRYMQTIDPSTLFNLGCSQTNQNGVVILDFGAPRNKGTEYGTTLFSGGGLRASISGIETSVKAFLDGYYECPGNGRMIVAVGTSNNGNQVTFAHGQAWGQMIGRLNDYVSSLPSYSDRLAVVGASDIELDWNTPTNSRAWADGYASASSGISYFNYGDANGCPTTGTGNCVAPHHTWTMEDVWYVSWGNSAKPLPVPEIYYNAPPGPPTHAQRWANLATLHSTNPMFIPGALTQWQACRDPGRTCDPGYNTPVQAWQQLMDALYNVAADPSTVQNILYSSDITWQN